MKNLILFLYLFLLLSCNNDGKKAETKAVTIPSAAHVKVYGNERFKEVVVKKITDRKFQITGKGQIFEANFGWAVEDAGKEIQKGFQMTDAGAPEWGNFSFIVEVQKNKTSSTLMLILFESSPKDGSRQYQLPIVLE